MLDAAYIALINLFSITSLSYLLLGVLVGAIVGILPGLGGTAGLALLLPFTFGMGETETIAMMIGLLSVLNTADTFPSVLMGIPGTSASQATVMDGFPMARSGHASRALAAAFSASMIGGVFGAIVLSVAIFFAKPLILAIGLGEQMMLIILAMTMVGVLSGASPIKGLAAAVIGMMLGTIGATPTTGVERLTFGFDYLIDPLQVVLVGLAIFALPEIVHMMRERSQVSKSGSLGNDWMEGIRDTFRNWFLVLRCSGIGCLLGALPGLGGAVIDWFAYGHAVQSSKDKENFGKGDVRGVIAPESANNSKEGGALIPTLLFGIPGSSSMAVFLGGLFMLGISPGVTLITYQTDLIFLMVWSLAVANIVGAGLLLMLAPQIAKITLIPHAALAPFLVGLVFFAAFQATRDWGDLITLIALGIVGTYMKRFGWPRPALLVGFVLAPQMETLVYQSFAVYGMEMFQRPLVIVIGLLTLVSSAVAIRANIKSRKKQGKVIRSGAPKPSILFATLALGFSALVFVNGIRLDFLSGLFPMVAGGVGLCLTGVILVLMVRGRSPSLFEDSEADSGIVTSVSNAKVLIGLVALLALSALVGLVIGLFISITAFLNRVGGWRLLSSIGGATAFVLLMSLLGNAFVLEYPSGLLQRFIPLPFPFN